MDIENFIAEFKKTFVYDILSQTLTDEQLFEHAIDGDGVTWFKEQMRQMWDLWQAAKAQAVPEGFVVVPKEPTEKMIDAGVEETSVDWKRLVFGYKAMIEVQEPTND
ncbi:hypothetical protein ABEF79_06865 [Acinetobacter sp. ANC 7454]|uniref:hypothetical protein n=1 Tax=Acinetobacter thermotolerans TaxID=3151487 RepID=UPI00325AB67D